MSSFICEPIHFNSVQRKVSEIFLSKKNDGRQYDLFDINFAKKSFEDLYYEKDTIIVANLIGEIFDTLRNISVLTVNYQYGKHNPETIHEDIKTDLLILMGEKHTSVPLTDVEVYKAIQCLFYQIEIEHLVAIRPLNDFEKNSMKFLKDFNEKMGKFIINNLPNYQNAKWSIQ
jgi:hypothetical protein